MVNLVDIILLGTVGMAAYMGARQGFIKHVCAGIGVVGGLCVTIFAYGSFAFLSNTSGVRSLLLLILLLAVVLLCYSVSLTVGGLVQRRYAVKSRAWNHASQVGGGVVAAATATVSFWILATIFGGVGPQWLQQQFANSQVLSVAVRAVDAPPLFRGINRLLQPFTSPTAFATAEPFFDGQQTAVNEAFDNLDTAETRTSPAVVKIQAWGCGSTAEGSGFLISKRLIMTNAHILAGAGRMSVQAGNVVFTATPIWFDPQLDDAVLMTQEDVAATPLALRTKALAAGDIGAVLGYPANGALEVGDATVLQLLRATGYDIYGDTKITRNIYAIRASVKPGNSGGPLIDASGNVAGLVFGNSTSQLRTGYAIAASELVSVIRSVMAHQQQVGTGECAG